MVAFAADTHPARPAGLGYRLATAADRSFLAEVYADSRAEELAPVPWSEAQKQSFLAEQARLQHEHYLAHYPGADFWVVTHAGLPVGRVYVHASASEVRLMDVIILRSWRRRGWCRAILLELLDAADAHDPPQAVTLHVEHQNPIRTLYGELGFAQVEDRGVYAFLRRPPATSEPSPALS